MKPSAKILYKFNISNFSKTFCTAEGLASLAELEHEYTIQHSDKKFQNSKYSNFLKTFTNTECLVRLETNNIRNKLFQHLYRPQTNTFYFYNLLSENFPKSIPTSFKTFLHHREKGTQPYFTQVQNFRHRDIDPNKPFPNFTSFQQVSLLGNFAKQHPSNIFKTFIIPEGSVSCATSYESSQNFNNLEKVEIVVSFECLCVVSFDRWIIPFSSIFFNYEPFLPYQRIQARIHYYMLYYTIYYTENCYTIAPLFHTVTPPNPPVRTYRSVLSNPALRFYRRPIDQSPISWPPKNRYRRG